MSITRKELDRAGCGTPGCSHDHSVVYFHGKCHLSAPVEASYEKATGEIVMRCARCQELIVRVAVAGEPQETVQ